MQSWPSPAVLSLPATEGDAVPLSLFDSSTKSVRPTTPGSVASIYVCGITPYDATHLGHAATYLAFDLVQRQWLDLGHRVRFVQNITDVDDPLLERATRDGVEWQDLAAQQIELFRTDMIALRILAPEHYVGAVESMGEVSEGVARLLAAGHAYRVADAEYPDIYFDITATGRFGYESGFDQDTMVALFAERGGDPDRAGKRHRLDPLLWRMARPGEPSWPSAVGDGRAGWHIECAVIAIDRLGPTIDVQGGGSDLVFPHHECSAAHAEALTGESRFAGHYTHAGMIGLDGEKMSKSRGNLVLVSGLLAEGVDPMAIRLALLAGHYRTDRSWTDELLRDAEIRLSLWRRARDRSGNGGPMIVHAVRDALRDDLDTPTALAVLDRWAADDDLDGPTVTAAIDALLGIDLSEPGI